MSILARFLSNQVHWFTSDLLSVMSHTAKIYVKVVKSKNIAADIGERVFFSCARLNRSEKLGCKTRK